MGIRFANYSNKSCDGCGLAGRSLVSFYSGLAKITPARLIKKIVIGVEANGCNSAWSGLSGFSHR